MTDREECTWAILFLIGAVLVSLVTPASCGGFR